jgi:AcrR family transcriptional regulator
MTRQDALTGPAPTDVSCGEVAAPAERRRGRPRSERAERAILGAVLGMLEEGVSYQALTIEAVAARAGVGKATIYRRWPNKEGLFVDAVRSVLDAPWPELPGRSVRDDLVTLLEAMRASKASGLATRLLPGLYTEIARYPQVLERYMRVAVAGRRERLRAVLRRGVATGEVRADVDLDLAMSLLTGPILVGSLLTANAELLAPGMAAKIVDTVFAGIAAPQRPSPTPDPSPTTRAELAPRRSAAAGAR